METTALADDPAVATDTPPMWSERIARRLADLDATHPNLTDSETTVKAEITDETNDAEARDREHTEAHASEQGDPSRPESPVLDHWWLLVAPLAGAVVLSSISVLVEPNPLRTGTAPSGLLAFAVLTPFFLLCAAGTLALIRDAVRLRAVEAEWSPNPWHYVAPSAAGLTALHAYRVLWSTGQPEEIVGFVTGTLVVALVAASILAGPAYLFQRRRRLRKT